jgi:hypothetical protein
MFGHGEASLLTLPPRPDSQTSLISAAAKLGFCAVAALLTEWGGTPTHGSIRPVLVLYFAAPQAAVALLDRAVARSTLAVMAAYAPVVFFACAYKAQHGEPSGIAFGPFVAVVVQAAYYPGAAVYLLAVYLHARSVRNR